jgi:hypothetical protein
MSIPRIVELLEPISVAPADYTTTATWADVTGTKIDTGTKGKLAYTITNTGANSIDWKVLASNDDSTYVEVEASAALAAAASGSWIASASEMSFRYFKIQAQDTTSPNHGAAQVRGYAKI